MEKLDLLRGTLDMLILRVLTAEPQHGYAITRRLQELSDDALQIDEGSMYPALYRMLRRGWISARWRRTENNRRAKVYSLTEAGRKRLDAEVSNWARFSKIVAKVLQHA